MQSSSGSKKNGVTRSRAYRCRHRDGIQAAYMQAALWLGLIHRVVFPPLHFLRLLVRVSRRRLQVPVGVEVAEQEAVVEREEAEEVVGVVLRSDCRPAIVRDSTEMEEI